MFGQPLVHFCKEFFEDKVFESRSEGFIVRQSFPINLLSFLLQPSTAKVLDLHQSLLVGDDVPVELEILQSSKVLTFSF